MCRRAMDHDLARLPALDLGLAPALAGPGVVPAAVRWHDVGALAHARWGTDAMGRHVHGGAPMASGVHRPDKGLTGVSQGRASAHALALPARAVDQLGVRG